MLRGGDKACREPRRATGRAAGGFAERAQVTAEYVGEGSESLRNIGLTAAGYLDDVNVNDGVF